MTDEPDFLDSYAPIDGEVVTAEPWPLPEPREWAPAPSLFERLKEWATGVQHD